MLIKLTPQAPHPTVLFTIAFTNLPETLPCPLSWANQLNCLSSDELDPPMNHHCLDKAAGIPNLLENVSFDLNTMMATCTFVDGMMAEWPIEDPGCLRSLQGVVNDVSTSSLEAERERLREKEEEKQRMLDLMTPPPSPTKPKGHKKQRSLLMTIVASLVPLGSSRQSSLPTLPTSAPPSPPLSPRPSSSSSTFSSSIPPSSGPSARILRRRARSALVDAFRRYILPELSRHFPKGGYYAWIIQSTLRRASIRVNSLVEKSGGYIPDIGRPRVECGQDAFLDTTTACTPTSLYDDDDDDTDTDGSSVHTPSSSHFNTMSSTYTAQFASPSDPSAPYGRQSSSFECPSYRPQCLLSVHEIEECHFLSNFIDRLQRLYVTAQTQSVNIENENAHHEAMLEIRSMRRAWLNRSLVGGAHHSSRNVGLSMPFRSSPLAHTSWTSEDYELIMTPVNLDSFMEERKLDPDYESRLSEGVSRLRLSDGPKLFPVLEENEGEIDDDQVFVSREFGMEFGIDLEGGMHGSDHRDSYETADGDVVIGSEGLQVEFDSPHIRPRLRTSSMMQRRHFDNVPLSETEFPPSPTSSSSSFPRTPSPPPLAFLPSTPQSPQHLDSSSLLCQPIKQSLNSIPPVSTPCIGVAGGARMGMELHRHQNCSDMDVDVGVCDYTAGHAQEFTLGMDLPVKMHIPSPTRGRKQLPPPGYTMGLPSGDDDWIVNPSGGFIVDCR